MKPKLYETITLTIIVWLVVSPFVYDFYNHDVIEIYIFKSLLFSVFCLFIKLFLLVWDKTRRIKDVIWESIYIFICLLLGGSLFLNLVYMLTLFK